MTTTWWSSRARNEPVIETTAATSKPTSPDLDTLRRWAPSRLDHQELRTLVASGSIVNGICAKMGK